MWSKLPHGHLRRPGSSIVSRPTSLSSANKDISKVSKSSPFKKNTVSSKPLVSTKAFQQTPASFTHIQNSLSSSFVNWVTEARKTQIAASKSINNIWQQSWSQYKFTSPDGARQTHSEAIRQAIAEKYGSMATTILMVLSAVVTDAVFWWLAELLLDDGM